ncbi:hypothetical protein COCSUDRAFT_52744 [Coccomyxa subellipsoidea C-169]|uniref:Complex 1 LYR protein domain-containing protein n=1 Tax=Coccomyxa subellipsoidea (strain C-169) TaxID=574566 RepID=I0Z2Z2_COCSC|nr:hypothetical protein COCSUDRAFT_52744 [Coccomyxa subellipsoidea C-169]EIE25011.1 hypothetical protein COCSUDRAFT_52744 [Coccomyxa subellipsoidea C-169]|eukprot:XP_005649555.1 hypothetical protein COCSUDRAFT_52744 [Coccomyxa subellipsoidea C-169]
MTVCRSIGRISQAIPCVRCLSSQIHFGPSDGQLEEILDRSLEKKEKGSEQAPHVLTTRREALALYRDIWRYSRLFVWSDERGALWRDSIRDSARKEFELARHQTEPEVVTRLLLTGRDCVQQTVDKFMKKRQDLINAQAKRPPFGPA